MTVRQTVLAVQHTPWVAVQTPSALHHCHDVYRDSRGFQSLLVWWIHPLCKRWPQTSYGHNTWISDGIDSWYLTKSLEDLVTTKRQCLYDLAIPMIIIPQGMLCDKSCLSAL